MSGPAVDPGDGVLVRLLLPGRMPGGGSLPWWRVAQLTGYAEVVDGDTDWASLVELRDGIDVAALPTSAAGWIDPATAEGLTRAFGAQASRPWRWVRAHEVGTTADRVVDYASFSHLLDELRAHPFDGTASGGDVRLEAPRYADSVMIRCPEEVWRTMEGLPLEVHRVSHLREVPIRSE
ncbi:MAG: hypothetical protein ACRCYR_14010 [Phycicoccus sp.]